MARLRLALIPLAALLVGATGAPEPWDGHARPRDAVQFQATMLNAHNLARANVGAAPLAWDAALAGDAARYARTLMASRAFEHEAQDTQGENLWMGTRGAFSYDDMVGDWVAEKKFFVNRPIPSASSSGDFEDVGHYTQLIWRGTTHVGCAIATDRSDDYVVCRYRTAGNVEGEHAI